MRKAKDYSRARFEADVIKEARGVFDNEMGQQKKGSPRLRLVVEVDGAEWTHHSEDEFFSDYRRGDSSAVYEKDVGDASLRIQVVRHAATVVEVTGNQKSKIEAVFEVFEKHLPESRVPEPELKGALRKAKTYPRARFGADVIIKACAVFDSEIAKHEIGNRSLHLVADVDGAEWKHNSEHEFFSDYRRGGSSAHYERAVGSSLLRIEVLEGHNTRVTVGGSQRSNIEAVFEVFEKHLTESQLLNSPKPHTEIVIFIGHGHSLAWRDLKDHLQDKHGFKIEAYEVGARAGHTVRGILEGMLSKSSIAFLVMTAEDATAEGSLRARQNVVHEIGLFQGRLGFTRGIVLLEEGTEGFSNIDAIEQIRFSTGGIKEAFGEVLATIKREFPSTPA